MTDERKKPRNLTLLQKMRLAEFLQAEAVDGKIEYDKMFNLQRKCAHRLELDTSDLSQTSVKSVAREIGVELVPKHSPGGFSVLKADVEALTTRVERLEGIIERALAKAKTDPAREVGQDGGGGAVRKTTQAGTAHGVDASPLLDKYGKEKH